MIFILTYIIVTKSNYENLNKTKNITFIINKIYISKSNLKIC